METASGFAALDEALDILARAEAVSLAASLAAFALSWEAVSRFGYVLITLVLAAGIYAHLAAVLPRRRTGLAWTVGAVLALGLPAWMGVQWLNHARLSNQLYMSSLDRKSVV